MAYTQSLRGLLLGMMTLETSALLPVLLLLSVLNTSLSELKLRVARL
jgi:hypothetical protein